MYSTGNTTEGRTTIARLTVTGILMALVMVLAVITSGGFSAQASALTQTQGNGKGAGSQPNPSSPMAVLFDQLDRSETSYVWSKYVVGMPEFTTFGADDFIVPAGQSWDISQVEAQLELLGSSAVGQVNVYIWQNDSGKPGSQLYNYQMVTPISGATDSHVVIPLSPSAPLLGGHYWLGIQAVYESGSSTGDWGWRNSIVSSGYGAGWTNPGGAVGVGCTSWADRSDCIGEPAQPGQMFRLSGTLDSGGTPTPSPVCNIQFSDMSTNSTFYSYTECLSCKGIVSGYADGTFRPANDVTRGQIAKIVSNSAGYSDTHSTQTFEDVPTSHTFYQFIERLASRGIIGGYACGGAGEPCGSSNLSYFRSNSNASRGQLAKIVCKAFNCSGAPSGQTFEDVPANHTFYAEIEQLYALGAINGYACGGAGEQCGAGNKPYFRSGANVSRGQTSKIVANVFFPNCQTP